MKDENKTTDAIVLNLTKQAQRWLYDAVRSFVVTQQHNRLSRLIPPTPKEMDESAVLAECQQLFLLYLETGRALGVDDSAHK